MLSNKLKDNNDKYDFNYLFKYNNSKYNMLKEISKIINNIDIFINSIISLVFQFLASNYLNLLNLIKSFYSIPTIIYPIYPKLCFHSKKIDMKKCIYKYLIITNIRKNIIRDINYIPVLIIKFLLIINLYTKIYTNIIKFNFSKISLKIKGTGEIAILGNITDILYEINFQGISYLKRVYINGIEQDKIEYKYNFNQTINLVELIWDDNLNNCDNMFLGCQEIIEINLSSFNTSNVTSINQMFFDCTSLTSLDLSNFDTSQVTEMFGMFYSCSSLTSLDLSYFDTSQVIDMGYMFSYCSSLTSLNLSNFNTSKISFIHEMFSYCNNLEYINLYNFDELQ